MKFFLNKLINAYAKKKRRREKKTLLKLSRHLKFLQPNPPNLGIALKSIFLHPKEFFIGGARSAYQKHSPAITEKIYADALDKPLHSYLWNYYHQKDYIQSVKWMGIPTLKVIFDLWIYQEIIFKKKPDVIIEIGSHYGGSTLYLAHILDIVNHGQVISVEIHPQNFRGQHKRVIEIEGDCSLPEVLSKIKDMIKGKTVMVIHDGDHREFAAFRDLELYAPLVTKGHYFIMEDGIYDLYNPERGKINPDQKGPLQAIRRFMKAHPNCFEIDMNSERFLLTSNPQGYLIKKGDL